MAKKSKQDTSYLQKPQLFGVKWEHAVDWWDGPISGVCCYNGGRYYARLVASGVSMIANRRYVLIQLPEEVWEKEDEIHAFFVEKVGDSFEFDQKTGQRKGPGALKPYDTHHEFYDKYPPEKNRLDYDKYPVIGWFEG